MYTQAWFHINICRKFVLPLTTEIKLQSVYIAHCTPLPFLNRVSVFLVWFWQWFPICFLWLNTSSRSSPKFDALWCLSYFNTLNQALQRMLQELQPGGPLKSELQISQDLSVLRWFLGHTFRIPGFKSATEIRPIEQSASNSSFHMMNQITWLHIMRLLLNLPSFLGD